MLLIKPIFLSTLVATAVTAPTSELNERSFCQTYTDTFEEYGTVVLPQAQGIGQYHGVTYQAFSAGSKNLATGTVGGVIPHSGNDVAVATADNDLLTLGTVTLNGFGNIIASPSKSFDLYSFWFGCGQATTNGQVPSVPVGCAIGVTGYTRSNQVVPLASYNYAPQSATAAAMQLATLPFTFRDLRNVTIGIATGSLVTATTILVVDDIVHCNYSV